MRIGELAQHTGTTAKTLRFYEAEGLLPAPAGTRSGYRDYPTDALDRVAFVRDAQKAGFTLRQIGQILHIRDGGRPPCAHVGQLIDQRLDEVEQRLAELYDRQTESLWPQLSFTASVGVLTGTKLVPHLTSLLAWGEFRQTYPEAWVLSRDTGHDRPYGRNPYLGYDNPEGEPLFGGPDDDRLPPQTRVIGIEDENGDGPPVAVVRDGLAEAGVVELTADDTNLVAWHRPGQASALDADDVAEGRDIGTVGVFVPEIDGQPLTFTATDDGFRDTETGSTWNVLGVAIAGPLDGEQLTTYRHVDTFWHSWVAFQPDTAIVH